MNSNFVKTTFRGLLFAIPMAGFAYFIYYFYDLIKKQIDKIIETTALETSWQVIIVALLAVVVLVLVLYLIGRVMRTKPVINALNWIDLQLINTVPAYRDLKLKLDNQSRFLLENRPPVFVKFGDAERPGFLIDRHPSYQKVVVFIPKNMNTFNGNIYIVREEDVRISTEEREQFELALDHLGDGLNIS